MYRERLLPRWYWWTIFLVIRYKTLQDTILRNLDEYYPTSTLKIHAYKQHHAQKVAPILTSL